MLKHRSELVAAALAATPLDINKGAFVPLTGKIRCLPELHNTMENALQYEYKINKLPNEEIQNKAIAKRQRKLERNKQNAKASN